MRAKEFIIEKKTLKNTNPCWKGYKPVGTKKKDGRTVPNCVPSESVYEASWINGRLQDPEELVWKQTSLSYEAAVKKYGKDQVRVGRKNRLGEPTIEVNVPLGGTNENAKQQGVAEGIYQGQFKSKEEAIARAKEAVKKFRDPEDGIEIWAMPSGGFDIVNLWNSNGRNHVIQNGGKKLGTIGPRYKGVSEVVGMTS